jgi:hypothetical protein
MTDESIATIAETITEAIEARESAHREVAAVATTLDMIYRLRYDATEAAKRADVAPVKGLWFLSPVTTRDNTIRHVRKSMNNIVGIGHWCEFVDADGPGFLVTDDRIALARLVATEDWQVCPAPLVFVQMAMEQNPQPYIWQTI